MPHWIQTALVLGTCMTAAIYLVRKTLRPKKSSAPCKQCSSCSGCSKL